MNLQASSSEQPEQLQESQERGSLSGSDAFAAALARELEGGDDQPDGDESGDEKGGKPGESHKKALPQTLSDLAQALGVEDVSKLYDLKIPAPGGREPFTLGQLKDRFESWSTLEADRLAFGEEKVSQQAQIQQARDEVKELLALVPKDKLTTESLQRVAARVAQRNAALDAQVVQAIPEWKDPQRREADTKALAGMLAGYGFAENELKQIRDPRLLKFLRDAHTRHEQVKRALEAVKKVKPKNQAPTTTSSGAPRKPSAPDQRGNLRPQSGRERFSEILRKEL